MSSDRPTADELERGYLCQLAEEQVRLHHPTPPDLTDAEAELLALGIIHPMTLARAPAPHAPPPPVESPVNEFIIGRNGDAPAPLPLPVLTPPVFCEDCGKLFYGLTAHALKGTHRKRHHGPGITFKNPTARSKKISAAMKRTLAAKKARNGQRATDLPTTDQPGPAPPRQVPDRLG